jgi:hypothetical protein
MAARCAATDGVSRLAAHERQASAHAPHDIRKWTPCGGPTGAAVFVVEHAKCEPHWRAVQREPSFHRAQRANFVSSAPEVFAHGHHICIRIVHGARLYPETWVEDG